MAEKGVTASGYGTEYTLNQQGLNHVELAYSPSWRNGQLFQQPAPLTDCISILAVLVTTLAFCYRELAISSLVMAIGITSTHYAYPRQMARLSLHM